MTRGSHGKVNAFALNLVQRIDTGNGTLVQCAIPQSATHAVPSAWKPQVEPQRRVSASPAFNHCIDPAERFFAEIRASGVGLMKIVYT